MNSFTDQFDAAVDFNSETASRVLGIIPFSDDTKWYDREMNRCDNHILLWTDFWILYCCFLAEVDQETIEAIIEDMKS